MGQSPPLLRIRTLLLLPAMPRAILFLLFLASSAISYTIDSSSSFKSKESLKGKILKPDCQRVSDGLGCACPVCKDVVQFTRMMILDHVPKEEQVLDKVCYRIFHTDQQKMELCESIIHSELPEIIKYVKNRVDPNKCCAKFC